MVKRLIQMDAKKIIIALLAATLLTACKTRERVVTIEKVRTDTAYVSRIERDSIFIEQLRHDSVLVREKGDTVLIEKWHTQYRDRWRDRVVRDTVYRDNVRTEYRDNVITEYRDRPLNWWQRTSIYVGGVAIWLVIMYGVVWFWRRFGKK